MKKNIVGLVFLIVVIVFFVVRGVSPLFAKANPVGFDAAVNSDNGRYVDDLAYYGTDEYYRITHLIGFIPAGYDHYFLVTNEDSSIVMVVRADKSFAEKFDEYGESMEGVRVKGMLKSMDHELRYEVDSLAKEIEDGTRFSLRYVDTLSDRYAVFTLLFVALSIGLAAGFFLLVRSGADRRTVIAKVWVIALLLDCIFGIHILVML